MIKLIGILAKASRFDYIIGRSLPMTIKTIEIIKSTKATRTTRVNQGKQT